MHKLNVLIIAALATIMTISGLASPFMASGALTTTTPLPSTGTINYITQSIQKGGFAGYMTWNGVWMAQQAFDFAKANFNTMILGSYQWENYPVSTIQSFKRCRHDTIRIHKARPSRIFSYTGVLVARIGQKLIHMKTGLYTTRSPEAEYGIHLTKAF